MEKIKNHFKNYPVTSAFIAIMIAYYIFLTIMGGSTNTLTLLVYGAFYPPLIAEYHEYYRFITSIFIHIGITHIFFNSYALYSLGPVIEKFMGKKKYFAFFLLTGISGNIVTYFFNYDSLSAGASGSIFGLLGAFLYLSIQFKEIIPESVKKNIVYNIVINLILTFSIPSISVSAHLGGLISGFLLSFIFLKKRKPTTPIYRSYDYDDSDDSFE